MRARSQGRFADDIVFLIRQTDRQIKDPPQGQATDATVSAPLPSRDHPHPYPPRHRRTTPHATHTEWPDCTTRARYKARTGIHSDPKGRGHTTRRHTCSRAQPHHTLATRARTGTHPRTCAPSLTEAGDSLTGMSTRRPSVPLTRCNKPLHARLHAQHRPRHPANRPKHKGTHARKRTTHAPTPPQPASPLHPAPRPTQPRTRALAPPSSSPQHARPSPVAETAAARASRPAVEPSPPSCNTPCAHNPHTHPTHRP